MKEKYISFAQLVLLSLYNFWGKCVYFSIFKWWNSHLCQKLRKTDTFFSRFEGTRGEKTQIFRTPADTEGKVVLMWMTGAYQYWTNYSTAINYAFVWVRRKTKLLFSKKILSFFLWIVPNFYKTKRIKTFKDLEKKSPDFITISFLIHSIKHMQGTTFIFWHHLLHKVLLWCCCLLSFEHRS